MRLEVLANWIYAIEIFLNIAEKPRFMVFQDDQFKTSCPAPDQCGLGESTSQLTSYKLKPEMSISSYSLAHYAVV